MEVGEKTNFGRLATIFQIFLMDFKRENYNFLDCKNRGKKLFKEKLLCFTCHVATG